MRTYLLAGNKGQHVPGDDARGKGTQMDIYTCAVKAAAGINIPSGPQPAKKTGAMAFTNGGTK